MRHLHFLVLFIAAVLVQSRAGAIGGNDVNPAKKTKYQIESTSESGAVPESREPKALDEKGIDRAPDGNDNQLRSKPPSQDTDRARWNRAKDLETFNTRVNSYSGRHGGGSSAAIPTVKPLVGPYVEYEFVDRNGDTWEKLGGSDEKLREYIAEHPEETFLDSEGELYGSLPMGLSISIQNNIDNSRSSNETTSNTIVNNSYVEGASISLDIGGTPVSVVVNPYEARLSLGENANSKYEEAQSKTTSNSDENNSPTKITINNNISVGGEEEESGDGSYSVAQAPESSYLWLLKKVGLRKEVKQTIAAQNGGTSDVSNRSRANSRKLASLSEVELSADFNWFAFAFVLTALVFATRELHRSKFRFLLPVPLKREKGKKASRTKPSEGTRATSATRMHFKKG